MVVMVMCNSYGYEYESKVLQTPDEETLVSEPHKDIMEICPSAIRLLGIDSVVAYGYKWLGGH